MPGAVSISLHNAVFVISAVLYDDKFSRFEQKRLLSFCHCRKCQLVNYYKKFKNRQKGSFFVIAGELTASKWSL
jgi:hypothetical protein